MAARVELREISNEEGNRLLRIVRRDSGSVVTWRRAQIVLLAAQRMPAPKIAEVVFTDADTVRDVIHNFNRDGFDALYPRYRGGRPRTFTLPERQQIKRIALSVPSDLRTWKRSNDPEFEAKKNRILELYAIADGLVKPGPDGGCEDEDRVLTASNDRQKEGVAIGERRGPLAQAFVAAGARNLEAACIGLTSSSIGVSAPSSGRRSSTVRTGSGAVPRSARASPTAIPAPDVAPKPSSGSGSPSSSRRCATSGRRPTAPSCRRVPRAPSSARGDGSPGRDQRRGRAR